MWLIESTRVVAYSTPSLCLFVDVYGSVVAAGDTVPYLTYHAAVPDGTDVGRKAQELDGHSGVARLKKFITLTRGGLGVTKASRELGITPEHATRCLKRHVVELLTEKLASKPR